MPKPRQEYMTVIVEIVHQTPRALLLRRRNGYEVWVPKRACMLGHSIANGYSIIKLKAEMAKEKGFGPQDT